MSVKAQVVRHWSSNPEYQLDRWEKDHVSTYIGKTGTVRFEDDDPLHPVMIDFERSVHPAGSMRFNRAEVKFL